MASKAEFVAYAAEQMKEAGQITCKKMFVNMVYTVTGRSLV